MGANMCKESAANTTSEPVQILEPVVEEKKEEPKYEEPKVEEKIPEKKTTIELKFELADKSAFTAKLEGSPIGMTFDTKMPIVIKNCNAGGHADKAGIKSGMTLLSIEGKEVANMSYSDAFKLLKDSLAEIQKKD